MSKEPEVAPVLLSTNNEEFEAKLKDLQTLLDDVLIEITRAVELADAARDSGVHPSKDPNLVRIVKDNSVLLLKVTFKWGNMAIGVEQRLPRQQQTMKRIGRHIDGLTDVNLGVLKDPNSEATETAAPTPASAAAE